MTDWLATARAGLGALSIDEAVRRRALDALERWLTGDAFAAYRPQLEGLIERGAFPELLDAFWQTIPFGTGGRRGPVGVGPNRFNPWTLGTSVQGHAEILRETYPDRDVAVVVAYDVRVFRDVRGKYDPTRPDPLDGLSSADFAVHAARVYAANGVHVHMLDPRSGAYMSTPELSLAIRHLGAQGGLNVSASHNHPDDNGGKFYNRHGGQDVPPNDEHLAQRVEGVTEVVTMPFEQARADGLVAFVGPEENEHYLAVNRELALGEDARGGTIVYTPLNGTGSRTVGRILDDAGFTVHPVPSQQDFDGGFPDVKFLAPNPEVPSCFEQARRVGDAVGADILLATDPDADRIGLQVHDPDRGWVHVTGNEIIYLVTDYVLSRRAELGRLPERGLVIKTAVTSGLTDRIAKAYGCRTIPDLLVGFKYHARVLEQLEETGRYGELEGDPSDFVIGVEESHGLLLTPAIRDKDAGGPALALAELNARAVAAGRTLLDELDRIYDRFGYVANQLFTTVMTGADGLQRMRAIQQSLRDEPPAEVGGRRVASMQDMADPDGPLGPILSETDASSRNVLLFTLEDGARIVIRPSGTEPKNKIYVEEPGDPGRGRADKDRVDAACTALGRAFEQLMLARVGIELPDWALAVSSLVSLDHKRDLVDAIVPELARRADAGQGLDAWVDEVLAPFGKDPRELVAPGIARYLEADGRALSPRGADAIRRAFALG